MQIPYSGKATLCILQHVYTCWNGSGLVLGTGLRNALATVYIAWAATVPERRPVLMRMCVRLMGVSLNCELWVACVTNGLSCGRNSSLVPAASSLDQNTSVFMEGKSFCWNDVALDRKFSLHVTSSDLEPLQVDDVVRTRCVEPCAAEVSTTEGIIVRQYPSIDCTLILAVW